MGKKRKLKSKSAIINKGKEISYNKKKKIN